MLLWLAIVSLLVALAGEDQISVTLVVDDREAERVEAAQVVVEGNPVVTARLTDDGSCPGDMPDDRILTACFDIQKRESLSFGVLAGSERLGTFDLFLPNAQEATVSLRAKEGRPALLLDMAAEQPRYSAPEGPGAEAAPKDMILLMVVIDDVDARALEAPRVRIGDRDDLAPVDASDAGLLLGDQANDGLWRADLSIVRTPTVIIELLDGDRSHGEVELVLPAKPRAAVKLTPDPEGQGVMGELFRELPSDFSLEGVLETSLLRLSIQDSTDRSLVNPVVSIEGQEDVEPVAASDQGLLQDDVAGDGIWRADVTVQRTPTVTVALSDASSSLGKASFTLPSAREVAVSVVRKGAPARLVVTTEAISSLGDQDSVVLVVELDDRAAARLDAPVVSIDQDNVEPALALDDGTIPGDVARDGIFLAELDVERAPRVVLTLHDGDTLLGSVDAPLPATESATVRLRTRHGSPAVALVEQLDMGNAGAAREGGGGSVWLIVWLNLGLFVVLVAWVRRTVRRAIDRELNARGADPGDPDA